MKVNLWQFDAGVISKQRVFINFDLFCVYKRQNRYSYPNVIEAYIFNEHGSLVDVIKVPFLSVLESYEKGGAVSIIELKSKG